VISEKGTFLCPDKQANSNGEGVVPVNISFDHTDILSQAFPNKIEPSKISYFVVNKAPAHETPDLVIYKAASDSELSIEGMLEIAEFLAPETISPDIQIIGGGVYDTRIKRTLQLQEKFRIKDANLQKCIDNAFETSLN